MRLLIRALFLTLGMLAGLPLLVLLLLLPTTPITFGGFLYLLGGLIIASGLITLPWWQQRSSILLLLGTGLILITLSLRLLFPASGSQLVLVTLPDQSAPRLWNRVFNEQDVVLFGAGLAPYLRLISPAENDGLVSALAEEYAALQGVTPLSPFLLTYLNQQRPDAFDALIAEPATDIPSKRAIVFLHGYGGNFTLQCWLVAHADDQIGALTICPSTRASGDWWSASGEMILQQTLRYL